MPTIPAAEIELAYTRQGEGDPVVLITGLSGNGRGWGTSIDRFAVDYDTIVPDHPGTGDSGHPDELTLEHHARAMAELVAGLGVGPAHIVGSSTGGAIAQIMALDHPETVRTISLVSSWARADDFFRHQFAVRKDIALRLGGAAYAEATALFLYSPPFFRDHYDQVRAWCDAAGKGDPDTMAARIDMILDHDLLDRLGGITCPTLVLVGSTDGCTPPHLSQEVAAAIPGAEYVEIEGGHLIYKEAPEEFHRVVTEFLGRH
ncbi:MAG TPA: alpha/beta fold hydrolase [Acidimicrobiia bacterium]|nr:alpha/beta fold hydrolase [Acidimicrobiia bacterium]